MAYSGEIFISCFRSSTLQTRPQSYLDNPELMSGASFLGLALISRSKLVGLLAVLRLFSRWWFLHNVEM